MRVLKRLAAAAAAAALVFSLGLPAFAVTADLPALPADRCVVDDANVLSSTTEDFITTLSGELQKQCKGSTIAVLTVQGTGALSTEQYAYEAFNEWGIGDKNEDNGILILLTMTSKQYADGDYYLMYGDGFNNTVVDSQSSMVLQTYMEDEFVDRDFDAAVTNTADAAAQLIADVYDVTLSGGSTGTSSELIAQMLGSFLTGNMSSISGLSSGNTGFLSGRALSTQETADYLAANQLDASALVWQPGEDGVGRIALTEEQWELVHGLELNMFYDDGQGYIDLGLDNVFVFDAQGALLGHTDGTWLAINGQPVAYYHLNTVDDGENYTITGRVPVMLNEERADLILVFDNENPYGFIAGARTNYTDGQTETVAKNMTGLQVGDTLDFLCDYYGYDGSYQDSYYLGEQMVVEEDMYISIVDVGADAVRATYRFTDLYNQHYWTEPIS